MVVKRKKKSPKRKASLRSRKELKVAEVMEEFKKGKLRSGSKRGPKVRKPKQAIAIALSEAKRDVKRRKRK